jgi:hypothetical protein
MRFVRYTVSKSTGTIIAVSEQDVPYEHDDGGLVEVDGHECEVIDLGAVEMDPIEIGGTRKSVSRQLLDRLAGPIEKARALLVPHGTAAPGHDCVRYHPVPCTLAGLQRHFRKHGAEALSVKVRAWLALTLPQAHSDALGLGGVPIAALKAMERVRNRRDPKSGTVMQRLERIAQSQSDARSARALRARNSVR